MSTDVVVTNSNRSAYIGELAGALSKAQGAMTGATKDSSNPFFKSKYADLASVWDACRKPLSDNGLAIIQMPVMASESSKVAVETILAHSSGEWISGILEMTPTKNDPQGVGSAITYIRRYALQSAVGIAPEDDDGNAASGKAGNGKSVERTTEAIPLTKAAATTILPSADQLIDGEQQKKLHVRFRESLSAELKVNADALLHDFLGRKLIMDENGNPSAKGIRKTEFSSIGKEAVEFAKFLSTKEEEITI